MGGKAAHQKGTAHEFNSDEARAAGRKGGQIVSQNREHMALIGREGGKARGAKRAALNVNSATTPVQTPAAPAPSAPAVTPPTATSNEESRQRAHRFAATAAAGGTRPGSNHLRWCRSRCAGPALSSEGTEPLDSW